MPNCGRRSHVAPSERDANSGRFTVTPPSAVIVSGWNWPFSQRVPKSVTFGARSSVFASSAFSSSHWRTITFFSNWTCVRYGDVARLPARFVRIVAAPSQRTSSRPRVPPSLRSPPFASPTSPNTFMTGAPSKRTTSVSRPTAPSCQWLAFWDAISNERFSVRPLTTTFPVAVTRSGGGVFFECGSPMRNSTSRRSQTSELSPCATRTLSWNVTFQRRSAPRPLSSATISHAPAHVTSVGFAAPPTGPPVRPAVASKRPFTSERSVARQSVPKSSPSRPLPSRRMRPPSIVTGSAVCARRFPGAPFDSGRSDTSSEFVRRCRSSFSFLGPKRSSRTSPSSRASVRTSFW
jgi:hypothetical protein